MRGLRTIAIDSIEGTQFQLPTLQPLAHTRKPITH